MAEKYKAWLVVGKNGGVSDLTLAEDEIDLEDWDRVYPEGSPHRVVPLAEAGAIEPEVAKVIQAVSEYAEQEGSKASHDWYWSVVSAFDNLTKPQLHACGIEDGLKAKLDEDDHDWGPYVCPGCYAMGSEPHAAYCPDAAIEREMEDDWSGNGK